jgi:hypothetical protein
MKADIKRRWIEALRSGKYEQTTRVLHRANDGFCCLGVLCDLLDPTRWGTPYTIIDKNSSILAQRWDSYASRIAPEKRIEVGLDELAEDDLMCMNDNGRSFSEIADYIENEL